MVTQSGSQCGLTSDALPRRGLRCGGGQLAAGRRTTAFRRITALGRLVKVEFMVPARAPTAAVWVAAALLLRLSPATSPAAASPAAAARPVLWPADVSAFFTTPGMPTTLRWNVTGGSSGTTMRYSIAGYARSTRDVPGPTAGTANWTTPGTLLELTQTFGQG